MTRHQMILCICASAFFGAAARADVVTDWNATLRDIAQSDGANPLNTTANPGWFTRAAAMENGAIYDVFQAFTRTNSPFLVNTTAPAGASLNAAVNQAAFEVLSNTYPAQLATMTPDYNSRMNTIASGNAKTDGIALGHAIAQAYITNRANDHASESTPYTPGTLPGQWQPDPYHPTQKAWGPGWGTVTPFAIGSSAPFVAALTPPPALNSQAYTDAFNQVKAYGAVNSAVRTAQQTEEGLFWAYDRALMGPPPVMFDRNLSDIGIQVGNTPAQNARMFAMASVALADAATAAWDAKFQSNYWRPVTAIQQAGNDGTAFDDGNPNTVGDVTWRPLGAPGNDPNSTADDSTPPFPSWTSGHGTMGSAMFQSLELFFGTNSFAVAAAKNGIDPGNGSFTLSSDEYAPDGIAGMTRTYSTFMQTGVMDIGTENSPEGEIAMSRIYLGVHWMFDQQDGMQLGHSIGSYVFAHDFAAVPEPNSLALAAIALGTLAQRRRRSVKLQAANYLA
jgi:PEP-CTERM motif-containing protein